jgi:hypothetical protein
MRHPGTVPRAILLHDTQVHMTGPASPRLRHDAFAHWGIRAIFRAMYFPT